MLNPIAFRSQEKERAWYKHARGLIPRSEGVVLDLGAGLGEMSDYLARCGFSVHAADGSPDYGKVLKDKGYHTECFDFNDPFPYEDGFFDGVISLEVIEHVERAEQFVQEIYRILKPGGWCVISTPNVAWLGYRVLSMFGFPPPQEGYHFRFFTTKSLLRILQKQGFKIQNSAHYTPVPFLNRLLVRIGSRGLWPRVHLLPNLFSWGQVWYVRK